MRWQVDRVCASLYQHYRSLLRACARDAFLEEGRKLHASLVKNGLASLPDSFIQNALLHMYAACGCTFSAGQLFEQIPCTRRDTVDWTTLMRCYGRHGLPRHALLLYRAMQVDGVRPDEVTLLCLFNACSRLGDVVVGAQGHLYVIKTGLPFKVTTSNAAMDMYVKCGQMSDARRVFEEMSERTVVSWTIILSGALKWEGLDNASQIYDEMPERNEVAWTVMIAGYLERGFPKEASVLIGTMLSTSCLMLNHVTLCSILSACSLSGDLTVGGWVHAYVMKTMGSDLHIMVGTGLVDMYSKCGKINIASQVFERMTHRNVITWNAMLSGLAMHGRGEAVLGLFPQMVSEAQPDDITFVSILSACSHSGLLDQAWRYFRDLGPVYGIEPKVEHYACVIDLFGRAGRLEDALALVREMPIPRNEVILGSLLASCSLHGKLQLGEHLLRELIQIDPCNVDYHVLLSNMYILAGRYDKANFFRQVLKKRGIRKVPGISSIHVNGQVHRFTSGDKLHPRMREIYAMLDVMIQKLRLAGYVPNTASQTFSVSESQTKDADEQEEKEQALFSHSEKLAVSFGLISTKPGTTLYIFKNLRICQDCHAAFKLISSIYNREIIIRDRFRFHSFRQGLCSCSDYW